MKIYAFPIVGTLFLTGIMGATAKSKTAFPVKVDADQLRDSPYRFNGAITTSAARGSGFCAWNRRTFFSAAHVVFAENAWEEPPVWNWLANSATLDEKSAVQSRGYFRWTEYAELATNDEYHEEAFGKDVILGFAFKDLMPGSPAKLNLNGSNDLRQKKQTLITGYPAEIPYNDKPVNGFLLHETGPTVTPYKSYSGRALTTTLVSTGPGNSGGPIWMKSSKHKGWDAAGVLVGGLPSESVVYAFSNDINSLLRAVTPVIQPVIEPQKYSGTVSASSRFFPYYRWQKIPDGVHKWTTFKIPVNGFEDDSTLEKVIISLDIRTAHRGDLQVVLEGPGGLQAVLHNEQGASKNNLILKNIDVSASFTDIDPNDTWYLRVQDRLKGDTATLKSIVLEISAAAPEITTEP